MEDIFTFDTTHHALWAEEIAETRGIPVEVIPAPPEAGARCDLAIRTLPDRVEEFAEALRAEGVEYRVFAQP